MRGLPVLPPDGSPTINPRLALRKTTQKSSAAEYVRGPIRSATGLVKYLSRLGSIFSAGEMRHCSPLPQLRKAGE